jgi:uncharacterized RDD family membrane protein YckC
MSSDFNDPTNPYSAPTAPMGQAEIVGGYTGYGSFWARFGAAFLDGLIVGAINFGIGMAIGILLAVAKIDPNENPAVALLLNLIGLVISLSYNAGFISSASQATPGKMALGLKVTDLNGQRISLGRAIGRELGKILSGLILLIGYLMQPFTAKKQALHDMIAGTLVLKTR